MRVAVEGPVRRPWTIDAADWARHGLGEDPEAMGWLRETVGWRPVTHIQLAGEGVLRVDIQDRWPEVVRWGCGPVHPGVCGCHCVDVVFARRLLPSGPIPPQVWAVFEEVCRP